MEYLRGKSRTPFVLLALASVLVVMAMGRPGVNYSPFGVPFRLQLVGVQFADPLAVSC